MGNLHATAKWVVWEQEEVPGAECSAVQCRKQKVFDLESNSRSGNE